MTVDKPEEGSHLRTLARSRRQARSHRQSSIASPKLDRIAVLPSPSLPIGSELQATCQASIVIGYYPVRSLMANSVT